MQIKKHRCETKANHTTIKIPMIENKHINLPTTIYSCFLVKLIKSRLTQSINHIM